MIYTGPGKMVKERKRRHRRRCNRNIRKWRGKQEYFERCAARFLEAEEHAKQKRLRYSIIKQCRLRFERRALECAARVQHWQEQLR